jgi:hypothetical protein
VSKYASFAFASGAGLAAGLIGSLVIHSVRGVPPRHPTMVAERMPEGVAPSDWLNDNAHARLLSLEARMASLQQTKGQSDRRETDHTAETTSEELDQATLELNPERGYERSMQRWERVLAAFEADPVDPAWAEPTARDFRNDLMELSQAVGFRLDSTDCRTTQCAGTTTWPNHAQAVAGFGQLLHHRYKQSCGTTTTLPNPSAGTENQPYTVTVIFDCTESRAGG